MVNVQGGSGMGSVGPVPPHRETVSPTPPTGDWLQDVFIPDFRGVAKKAKRYPLASKFDVDPDAGGPLSPKFFVWHHTVSYNLPSTANWFKTTSADIHFLIGHKGEVVQMVDLDRIAHHAGASEWAGLKSLNNHALGGEFINIGPLKKVGNSFVDFYGRRWEGPVRERKTLGFQYWEPLTEAQEQRFLEIGLFCYVSWGITAERHIGHYECAPVRKNDPAGAFSWGLMDEARKRLKAYIVEAKRRGLA